MANMGANTAYVLGACAVGFAAVCALVLTGGGGELLMCMHELLVMMPTHPPAICPLVTWH